MGTNSPSEVDNNDFSSQMVETGDKEITTHTAIYTLHLDGLRELYRQFLRLPDGALVEIFGDIATAMLGSPDLKAALIKKQRQMEDDLDDDIKSLEAAKKGFFSRLRKQKTKKDDDELEPVMEEDENTPQTDQVEMEQLGSRQGSTLRRRNTGATVVENQQTAQEDTMV